MIFVITTIRPGDDTSLDWLFDDPVEFKLACEMLDDRKMLYLVREDYITDSHEFHDWLTRRA